MVENPVAGGFYFISDKFYSDFLDPYLMPNKADEDGLVFPDVLEIERKLINKESEFVNLH